MLVGSMRIDKNIITSIDPKLDITKPTTVEDNNFQETLNQAINNKDNSKLLEVCQQFEGYFINQMLQKMRQAIPKGDFFGNDPGAKIFQGMLDENLSTEMSKAGGIGLAQMMYDQLTKEQIKPQIDKKG